MNSPSFTHSDTNKTPHGSPSEPHPRSYTDIKVSLVTFKPPQHHLCSTSLSCCQFPLYPQGGAISFLCAFLQSSTKKKSVTSEIHVCSAVHVMNSWMDIHKIKKIITTAVLRAGLLTNISKTSSEQNASIFELVSVGGKCSGLWKAKTDLCFPSSIHPSVWG